MSSPLSEMLLLEDGRCEPPQSSLRIQDYEGPLANIVSREEFEQLLGEHAEETEGVTYEEYCETERECWNDMLQDQLKPLWEKSIPDSIIDKNAVNIQSRPKKISVFSVQLLNKAEVIQYEQQR